MCLSVLVNGGMAMLVSFNKGGVASLLSVLIKESTLCMAIPGMETWFL